MLRSDLCDYSDAYIVVEGDITLAKTNGREIINKRNRFLAFKNNAAFTSCISKINNVLIDNAEDLDIVISMYSLLENSKNYRKNNSKSLELLQRYLIMLFLMMMTPQLLITMPTL